MGTGTEMSTSMSAAQAGSRYSAYAGVLGAATSAYSGYAASRAASRAYQHRADIADTNRKLAEFQARDALARGKIAANRNDVRTMALVSQARAGQGASGLVVGSGSGLAALVGIDTAGATDSATIRTNADREAWGALVRGSNFGGDAAMLRSAGEGQNPYLAGTTALLRDSGTVADRWYKYRNANGESSGGPTPFSLNGPLQ